MNKRSLIVMMLIGVLSVGMFVGCESPLTGGGGGDTKVVAEKYRGRWGAAAGYPIFITANAVAGGPLSSAIHAAWTEGNILYYRITDAHDCLLNKWTFTDDYHFTFSGNLYTKEP
jgi:hypothetical protein